VARGELLRKLFLSHKRGGEDEFRAAALEIIAEEQNKNNRQLARDLLGILDNSTSPKATTPVRNGNGLPKDREKDALLVDVQTPSASFDDIILRPESRSAVDRVIAEFRHCEVLRTHGLAPKSKLLFVGPPGCGKTLCAKIIANELGLPLLYTRFDAIVSSYLGETAANLRKVFDYAANGHWLVLFDEFDAIAKLRDDQQELGELKRVVNSFLQNLDSLSSEVVLIAATNHEQLLDPAVWRRFQYHLYLGLPEFEQREQFWKMFSAEIEWPSKSLKVLADLSEGFSVGAIETVCLRLRQRFMIKNEQPSLRDAIITLLSLSSDKHSGKQALSLALLNNREKLTAFLRSRDSKLYSLSQIGEIAGFSPATMSRLDSRARQSNNTRRNKNK